MIRFIVATMLVSLFMTLPVFAKSVKNKKSGPTTFGGVCSYYTNRSSGHWTANGEWFKDNELTAANWWLSFGTKVKVTNLCNGKSVIVRINDRGPAHRLHRCIDLSLAAAKVIGNTGLCKVAVTAKGVDQQWFRLVAWDWSHFHKTFTKELLCNARD